jgi:hypothetical protein
MIMALVRKELRELLPLAALALVAQFIVISTAMHLGFRVITKVQPGIPFLDGDVIWNAFFVAGVFAVAAGLRQTMWESARGTFQFLLHRPVNRETIFAVKLAVGSAASALVLVVPLGLYSVWAATPGTHASPFFWPMSFWAWQLCLEMLPLYLGIFLSGLRPARWYGSRFIPFAASAAFVQIVMWSLGMRFSWQVASVATSLVIDAALVVAILYVAKSRDFS